MSLCICCLFNNVLCVKGHTGVYGQRSQSLVTQDHLVEIISCQATPEIPTLKGGSKDGGRFFFNIENSSFIKFI